MVSVSFVLTHITKRQYQKKRIKTKNGWQKIYYEYRYKRHWQNQRYTTKTQFGAKERRWHWYMAMSCANC